MEKEIETIIKQLFPKLKNVEIPIYSSSEIEKMFPQLFNIFFNVFGDEKVNDFYIEIFGKKIFTNKEVLYNIIYIINLDILVEYDAEKFTFLFKLQSFFKKYLKKAINFILNKKFKIITEKNIYKFSINQIILKI